VAELVDRPAMHLEVDKLVGTDDARHHGCREDIRVMKLRPVRGTRRPRNQLCVPNTDVVCVVCRGCGPINLDQINPQVGRVHHVDAVELDVFLCSAELQNTC
jgi:hypothetical protein